MSPLKVFLTFLAFGAISLIITSVCVLRSMEPWQVIAANVAAGGILGLLSGFVSE